MTATLNNIPKDLIVTKKQEKDYKSYKLSLSKLRTQDQKYNEYFLKVTNQQNLLNERYETTKINCSKTICFRK